MFCRKTKHAATGDKVPEPFNALAIDGGGVRGIVAAAALRIAEERLGATVAESIDLVGGTSAGALVAVLLATRDEHGSLRTAEDAVQAFSDHAARIFPANRLRGGPGRPQPYLAGPIKDLVNYLLPGQRPSDCVIHTVIPVYDMASASPYVFDSARAVEDPEHDYALADVLASAVAAPFYFDPYPLRADTEHQRSRLMVDGGVYANNPAMIVYSRARQLHPSRPLRLLSVSTGSHRSFASLRDDFSWNTLHKQPVRVKDLLNVVLDGSSDSVDVMLRALLDPADYYRIDPNLPQTLDSLDDARKSTLDALVDQVGTAMTGADLEHFLIRMSESASRRV